MCTRIFVNIFVFFVFTYNLITFISVVLREVGFAFTGQIVKFNASNSLGIELPHHFLDLKYFWYYRGILHFIRLLYCFIFWQVNGGYWWF